MINVNNLKNVVQKDGKIEAQCPACNQAGADSKGNHMVIYPDGSFGCVANPGDKEHNKAILKLVGDKGARPLPQLQIRREDIPESKVLMKIGRSGQKKPSPIGTREDENPERTTPAPDEHRKTCPSDPEGDKPTSVLNEFTVEDVRRFLDAA